MSKIKIFDLRKLKLNIFIIFASILTYADGSSEPTPTLYEEPGALAP